MSSPLVVVHVGRYPRRRQRQRRHRRVVVVVAGGIAPPSRPSHLLSSRCAAPAGCCVSPLCRPIVLRCPLLLSSRRPAVACRVASVDLSCRAAFLSSRRASWLLHVANLCRPIFLVAQPSCPLVVPARCCVSRRICRPILLRRVFVILSLAMPLSPHHAVPPPRPLIMPASCCVSRCRPFVLRCPLVAPAGCCLSRRLWRHIIVHRPLVPVNTRPRAERARTAHRQKKEP